jgi:hypothetical protein
MMAKTPVEPRAELTATGDITQFQSRVNVETDDAQISLLMTLLVHEFQPFRIDSNAR